MNNVERQGLSIVALGDFNPKIFSPAWFASEDLIGKHEANAADVKFIHRDVSAFSIEWFKLQVDRERFIISTEQQPYFKNIIDFMLGTFSILQHTPIRAVGINRTMDIRMSSRDERDNLGYYLAPKSPWKNIFDKPAMMRLDVTDDVKIIDEVSGKTSIQIEPSKLIYPDGIYFNLNRHYQVNDEEKTLGATKVISAFKGDWESALKEADRIISSLLQNFSEVKK